MAAKEDEGDIAQFVAYTMESKDGLPEGWDVQGLDIGEVEITVPNGQRFRLSVEEITDEED